MTAPADIKTPHDIRELLKDLSTYSGLATRITDQCKEATRVMDKHLIVGPGGVSGLQATPRGGAGGVAASAPRRSAIASPASRASGTYDSVHIKGSPDSLYTVAQWFNTSGGQLFDCMGLHYDLVNHQWVVLLKYR